jgi:endonuclease YncB( thermonuclease family)
MAPPARRGGITFIPALHTGNLDFRERMGVMKLGRLFWWAYGFAGRVRRGRGDLGAVFGLAAALALICAFSGWGQVEPKVERPRPNRQAAAGEDVPGEDQLYVWPLPQTGNLMLVLKVHDGDTVEAAVLVPITVRVNGIDAPELNTEPGKASAKFVNELLGGRLLLAKLHGREKYGRTLADFWLGKPGQDAKAPSGWASEWIVKKGYARPWSGRGPKPNPQPAPEGDGEDKKDGVKPMKQAEPQADKGAALPKSPLEELLDERFDAGEILSDGSRLDDRSTWNGNRRLNRFTIPKEGLWRTKD